MNVLAGPQWSGGIGWKTKLWRGSWMIAAIVAIGVLVFWLVMPHRAASHDAAPEKPAAEEVPRDPVTVVGPQRLRIAERTPLRDELAFFTVKEQTIAYPLLTVTGSVVARVRAGAEALEDRWQFAAADVSSAYADWLRTKNDIQFGESQLGKTRELVRAETAFLQETLKRLRGAAPGSIPEKEIRQAEADLLKEQIQGQKEIYEAESALRIARKSEHALERQLSQAGIEPTILERPEENLVLLSANVPEGKLSLVHAGQACQARFYSYPNSVFTAHVEALSSSVTPERRMLRVLFHVEDPDGLLRPGMFAEVALGTDPRPALVVPANALLHIGRDDYVLVQDHDDADQWHVIQVQVGQQNEGQFEVLKGLTAGDRIISRGVVLLKPTVVQSLAPEPEAEQTGGTQ